MIYRTKNHRELKPQKISKEIKVISNKSMIAAKILEKNVIKSVFWLSKLSKLPDISENNDTKYEYTSTHRYIYIIKKRIPTRWQNINNLHGEQSKKELKRLSSSWSHRSNSIGRCNCCWVWLLCFHSQNSIVSVWLGPARKCARELKSFDENGFRMFVHCNED